MTAPLITSLEQAGEGSREMDTRIANHFDTADTPPVTTSLDAALALAERVLPPARWMMVQQPCGWGVVPLLFDGSIWESPNEPGETVHASLPIALCIASLRAAHQETT